MRQQRKVKDARWLGDLRESFQRALLRMQAGPVLVSDPKLSLQTIKAMQKHGLIVEGRDRRTRAIWKPSARALEIMGAEEIRVLADRGRDDYTDPDDRMHAMSNEPEPVDALELERQAKEARERAAKGRDVASVDDRRQIALAIERLEQLDNLGEFGAQRLADMRRSLAALDRELKAA